MPVWFPPKFITEYENNSSPLLSPTTSKTEKEYFKNDDYK
jgi:hypothetical protein